MTGLPCASARTRIIVLAGPARSGKDTAADALEQRLDFVRVALADPLKAFCQGVYGWTNDQLWGPSELRDVPDRRYPRPGRVAAAARRLADLERLPEAWRKRLAARGWLTPRHALQTLGTGWGRACYADTWADLSARRALDLVTLGRCVVVTDGRHRNEIARFRKLGAEVWLVDRPGAGLKGAGGRHSSELELRRLPDSAFDVIVPNEGTIGDLERLVVTLAGGEESEAA
jgi:hypothetical protein